MFVPNELFTANEIDGIKDGDESIEKSGKLLKTRKLSKGLKLFKSGNSKGKKLVKSKKPSKNRNSLNFNVKKASLSFLTPETRRTFNCLWLAFTKAPIFWHFDLKYHIWIKTNVLGYAISSMLS